MNNGYKSLDDVAKEDPVYLMSLLMDQLPWSNPFCEEDEQTEAEDEFVWSMGMMGRYDKCVRLIDKLQKRGRREQCLVCLESALEHMYTTAWLNETDTEHDSAVQRERNTRKNSNGEPRFPRKIVFQRVKPRKSNESDSSSIPRCASSKRRTSPQVHGVARLRH